MGRGGGEVDGEGEGLREDLETEFAETNFFDGGAVVGVAEGGGYAEFWWFFGLGECLWD